MTRLIRETVNSRFEKEKEKTFRENLKHKKL